MIICKLMGGLGNQMFQYAMARSLSPDHSVYLDLNFLKSNTKSDESFTARPFELSVFDNLKVRQLNGSLLKLITTQNPKYALLKKLLPKSLRKIVVVKDGDSINAEKSDHSYYLDGYFQNPSYFSHIRGQLLKDFEFPELPQEMNGIKESIMNNPNAVSLHVRRGDYLKISNAAFHGVLDIDYYQQAISQIPADKGEPHYFIFSDDREWCLKNLNFIENKTIISGENKPWIDLYLMSLCKQHIIANSSFSWWGAWLSENKGKKVIAPIKWFNDESSEIIPEEWTRI